MKVKHSQYCTECHREKEEKMICFTNLNCVSDIYVCKECLDKAFTLINKDSKNKNCVCCTRITQSTFKHKFPLCYDCYSEGKLSIFFYQLLHNDTIPATLVLFSHISEVLKEAKEWESDFIEE